MTTDDHSFFKALDSFFKALGFESAEEFILGQEEAA